MQIILRKTLFSSNASLWEKSWRNAECTHLSFLKLLGWDKTFKSPLNTTTFLKLANHIALPIVKNCWQHVFLIIMVLNVKHWRNPYSRHVMLNRRRRKTFFKRLTFLHETLVKRWLQASSFSRNMLTENDKTLFKYNLLWWKTWPNMTKNCFETCCEFVRMGKDCLPSYFTTFRTLKLRGFWVLFKDFMVKLWMLILSLGCFLTGAVDKQHASLRSRDWIYAVSKHDFCSNISAESYRWKHPRNPMNPWD